MKETKSSKGDILLLEGSKTPQKTIFWKKFDSEQSITTTDTMEL